MLNLPKEPIGAIFCGECENKMELLSTIRVRCNYCNFEWRLINGKWSVNKTKKRTNMRLDEL